MKFLSRLFGKKPDTAKPPLLTPPPATPPPPGAPAMIKVWDDYGRVGEVSRETWRTQVLPHNFQQTWNDSDKLATLIHSALNDGFIADCLEPARQLHRIDHDAKRGATYLAVILLQLKQFAEAEKVVTEALQQHGEDGTLLTNLAKAQSGKGDSALAERTLWHALEVDPNLDNGLMWYQAIHRDRGGEAAAEAAFERVATLPGSWRAQVWMARSALQARNLPRAMNLYHSALACVTRPAPTDLLQQISGDLGNAGHLPEILQLIGPQFDPVAHGLSVGNNLIKAYSDLGQLDAARRILDQLYRQKRGDWKESLAFWDTTLAKAALEYREPPKEVPPVTMLCISGPVWLKAESPAAELFPTKSQEVPTVALIGSAIEVITNSKRPQHQMADTPGRMSRALPLFLAEQLEFRSNLRTQTLIPWIQGKTPAFALCGLPWEDDNASALARQSEIKSDYVITIFLKPNSEPWSAELRLVRTIDANLLGNVCGTLSPSHPEEGVKTLVGKLLELLGQHIELHGIAPDASYQVPTAGWFPNYLLRLEQLLAVRCAAMDGMPLGFLNGEREILDGNLQLCLEYPQNLNLRILLAQTLLAMHTARPLVVGEYAETIARLQKEQPLPEPAHSVVQRLLKDASAL